MFIPTLSVWETLAISTRLRLPGRLPAADRDALMDDSLRSMGLHRKRLSQVRARMRGSACWIAICSGCTGLTASPQWARAGGSPMGAMACQAHPHCDV